MQAARIIDDWEPALPSGTRVLIVEDQLLVAHTVSDMVETLGGIPEVAGTVEEGLDACARGEFDVALLDLDLNGCSAAPVAAALSAAEKPFLITTGRGRRIAGFDGVKVLRKPYPFDQLAQDLALALR